MRRRASGLGSGEFAKQSKHGYLDRMEILVVNPQRTMTAGSKSLNKRCGRSPWGLAMFVVPSILICLWQSTAARNEPASFARDRLGTLGIDRDSTGKPLPRSKRPARQQGAGLHDSASPQPRRWEKNRPMVVVASLCPVAPRSLRWIDHLHARGFVRLLL